MPKNGDKDIKPLVVDLSEMMITVSCDIGTGQGKHNSQYNSFGHYLIHVLYTYILLLYTLRYITITVFFIFYHICYYILNKWFCKMLCYNQINITLIFGLGSLFEKKNLWYT
jgi:hypothetical protein